jgi:hypothetical protein
MVQVVMLTALPILNVITVVISVIMPMLVRSFGVDIAVRKTTDRRIVQNDPRKVPLVMMTVHPHIKEYHFSQVIPVLIMTVTKMVEFFLATGVIDLAAVTKVDRSELSLH